MVLKEDEGGAPPGSLEGAHTAKGCSKSSALGHFFFPPTEGTSWGFAHRVPVRDDPHPSMRSRKTSEGNFSAALHLELHTAAQLQRACFELRKSG